MLLSDLLISLTLILSVLILTHSLLKHSLFPRFYATLSPSLPPRLPGRGPRYPRISIFFVSINLYPFSSLLFSLTHPIYLPLYLCVYLCIYLFIYLWVYLSVYLSYPPTSCLVCVWVCCDVCCLLTISFLLFLAFYNLQFMLSLSVWMWNWIAFKSPGRVTLKVHTCFFHV